VSNTSWCLASLVCYELNHQCNLCVNLSYGPEQLWKIVHQIYCMWIISHLKSLDSRMTRFKFGKINISNPHSVQTHRGMRGVPLVVEIHYKKRFKFCVKFQNQGMFQLIFSSTIFSSQTPTIKSTWSYLLYCSVKLSFWKLC
jgi:hypothetical protein